RPSVAHDQLIARAAASDVKIGGIGPHRTRARHHGEIVAGVTAAADEARIVLHQSTVTHEQPAKRTGAAHFKIARTDPTRAVAGDDGYVVRAGAGVVAKKPSGLPDHRPAVAHDQLIAAA